MPDVPINYWAVLLAGVSNMIIGGLWYSPLFFGKQWMHLMGLTKEHMEHEKKKGMATSYLVSFIGALVMAYVLSHVFVYASTYTKTSGVSAGLMVGFWSWLGFVATVGLGSMLWEKRPFSLYLINMAYYLVTLCVMGVILAVM